MNGQTVNNGQIQGITDTRGAAYSTAYTYDAWNRLSVGQTNDLTAANTWKLGWTYDRFGNRSAQSLQGGTISVTTPQLTISQTTNRITTGGFVYDAAGNMTNDGLHTYAYDGESRVATVDTTAATYSYDGSGLRVKKVASGTTTVYVFSGSKVIAEYAGGTLSKEYLYSGSGLLATVTGSAVTYSYPDHLSGRVEADGSGTVTRTFGHLPFGETWYETGTANKWKFTSYERDGESGLDYAMFRYDSSRLGRFMTPDPLAGNVLNPQSLNRYAYALNNPLSYVDPTGQECVWDDGSYDSAGDYYTGSQPLCDDAGGTWVDPSYFATLGLGDWSADPNLVLAGLVDLIQNGTPDVTAYGTPPQDVQTTDSQQPDFVAPHGCATAGSSASSAGSTGLAAFSNWVDGVGSAALMLGQFATGLGPSNVVYGPDTMQSQMMAASPGVIDAVNSYLSTGKSSDLYDFGRSQLFAAGINPIQQFVGSYEYNIQPVQGGLLLTLTNYTSVWSGSFHRLQSHQRSSFRPFGTTKQTYQVTVPCS